MAERRSVIARLAGACTHPIRRAFPERQILVRDDGRVRCFRLGTLHQLIIVAAITGSVLWALLATAAYFDGQARLASKEDGIAHKTAELEGLKASYQDAFGSLDEFQAIFSGITCEITDIQGRLLRIAEHDAAGHKGAVEATLPRLAPDADDCPGVSKVARQPEGTSIGEAGETRRIVGSLKAGSPEQEALRERVDRLTQSLAKLKASHGAFLQRSANLAALRIGELERTFASVGLDTATLPAPVPAHQADTGNADSHYGRGGPFIAAPPRGGAEAAAFDPVTLFNRHAARLDSLTTTLRALPLGQPLADYEVTSPFGARSDPILGVTGIHEGVDLGAPTGTPVMATGGGRVVWAGWRDRFGLMVEIDHGLGVNSRYAHLSKVFVSPGNHVARGTVIGEVGETGRTTGPHLHYEVRMDDEATNPMKFISAGQNVLKGH